MCKWFTLFLRVFLGGLFIFSGIAKIINPPQEFLASVLEYGILPYGLAVPFSYILPWAELIAGVFLVLGLFSRFSSGAMMLMLFSFIIALGINLIKGNELENCGCFGSFSIAEAPRDLFIRDIALFLAVLYITIRPSQLFSLDGKL